MKRSVSLEKVKKNKNNVWDIAVIGGGSSGFGVALDALSRGLNVILLEKADYAKGTSSRSTKLLHGGVRYLAQGDVGLVFEALKERGRLIANAPHLTYNQPFIIPVYTWFDRVQYSAGLKIYDWMAGRLRLGKSRFISKSETVKRLPQIEQKGLKGGVVYHDGQFDDARMIVALAQTCDEMGGCVLNYAKVTSLHKDDQGKINGLRFKDEINGEKHDIRAKMVVNATGVFADKILRMDKPDAPKSIRPSQGIHLVFDQSFLGGKDALMIPKTSDGRVLFAVPWLGKLVVGTTDTLRDKAKLEPEALEKEIGFVLETAQAYLSTKPERKDVLSVFAGLRPLAAPKEEGAKTKEISRSHKVIISESGLVSITGGKWTTFRKMGEDTVSKYPEITGESIKESTSAGIKVHGYTKESSDDHLAGFGADAILIRQMMEKDKKSGRKLHPDYPFTVAEIKWIVEQEMPAKVEDVLARRLRILFLDARASLEIAPKVAEIMADAMGFDKEWIEAELQDFNKTANKYILEVK
ncbi:glycerol-3-phosphate dehydrogenase/oxidase [Arthrospiribacter ruber]|uniref:Glycerol-3-phosphate dehydrogenase/oxidase n=1 Tax=Arthrospiribacter ruber TaxID=2487934 RepID=A0A951J006_9BACT|nr:glycerol-3-phosphate dehydrogenase/oxidase [Arthrospiribacter ruber]MBW3468758.1 glycerol-3-phosphate dehydrogenase/oxidase [Arthrospiribacter ruber]